jgi:hypothetical protein
MALTRSGEGYSDITAINGNTDHTRENTMQRVLRWEVPVDDEWHEIGAGRVVEVAARAHHQRPGDLVEVWTLEDFAGTSTADLRRRPVTVIGTGHPAPNDAAYLGTAIVPAFRVHETGQIRHPLDVESAAGLVWHVFGRTP